jgi:hypothetical protein
VRNPSEKNIEIAKRTQFLLQVIIAQYETNKNIFCSKPNLFFNVAGCCHLVAGNVAT